MSLPISACMISKAVFGTPEDREAFFKRMETNFKYGHFTISGCSHEPPCKEPSDEQIKTLADDLDKRKRGNEKT